MNDSNKISYEELPLYIDKMNKGNSNARIKVIHYYSNRIIKIIENNFNDKKYDENELFQAGFYGLLLALKRYSKHNFNICNIEIHRYIHSEIKNFIENDYSNIEISQKYIKTPMEYVIDKEDLELIFAEIEKLSEKQKNIIYLYFFEGYSQLEIARIYKTSSQTINEIIIHIIDKFKEQIYIKNIIIEKDNIALKSFINYLIENYEIELIEYMKKEGNSEIIDLILKLVKTKSKTNRNIIYSFFFKNYTLDQISKEYNIKYDIIKVIIDEFIFNIKNKLSGFENKDSLLNICF